MAILNTVAQFGRYMLRSRLVTAGACEVWIAEIDGAAHGTAPVIFKKLRSELAQNSALVEAFTLRAHRALHLSHDCIGRVLDVVVERSECGLAMEYIDGKTLRQLISAVGGARNSLPVWFAMHVAHRICHALEHAHDGVDDQGQPQRISHENLCPENVFLTFLGQIKVTDFGLSQATLLRGGDNWPLASMRAPANPNWQEQQTETLGTVHQDLDAVGRVLYELLTGICPAPTNDPNIAFLPPSHYAPWVNAEVDQLLSRILSPEDSKRFHSAREIRHALDEYLASHRHDVTATHIAGLISVLFSAECRGSAPPTMRLQAGALELAKRGSRRTTPPDLAPGASQNQPGSTRPSIPAQPSRPTIPSPATTGSSPGKLAHPTERGLDKADATDNRTGPFHHDWDLALKRAREEAQAAQCASGNYPAAAVGACPEPPIDSLERAVLEFERGLEHMRRGEFEGAMKAWERTLEFDPQHRVCRANLNLLKKKLGTLP